MWRIEEEKCKSSGRLSTHLHLEESLQRDIDHIKNKVGEMAGLVDNALRLCLRALVERKRQLSYSVILRDQYVDELETELNRLALEFLARHQPVAGHLRFAFTTIQINKELERIGDYAESVARQALVLCDVEPQPSYHHVLELGNLAVHMLNDAVESFLKADPDLAWRTIRIEERANLLRNTINSEVGDLVASGALPKSAANPLITVARRLERVTDQAKNLCEDVLYMCTGEFAKHKGAEAFRILFFDTSNNSLSQMAEGIARSFSRPRLHFSSAGITPQPLDPAVVAFMRTKKLDVSAQHSKSLEQVPDLDQFQVVISLDAHARDHVPDRPTKTIYLDWRMADPAQLGGQPEAQGRALEEAWSLLTAQIQELLNAIEEPHPHKHEGIS